MNPESLKILQSKVQGEVRIDKLSVSIYSTDASVYQETPSAVVIPKSVQDIIEVVNFAREHNLSLIPRAAGTSLAGQCVGSGIVVDVSKHFNQILEINKEEKTVWVQPGVIRDELNHFLKPHGLFFGPNTSTANRCMIGGMVGNNSCGSSSIKYGTTRDHVLAMKVILSDGSVVLVEAKSQSQIVDKLRKGDLEAKIYKTTIDRLSDNHVQESIKAQFPHPEIKRRNTGYAVDELLKFKPFNDSGQDLNLCALLTGSEGTLAFTTAIKLKLDELPLPEKIVVCPHFTSVNEAMKAVPLIMKFEPDMCELMDKIILDCTKENAKQVENRFFLDGDPQAVLMIQFNRSTTEEAEVMVNELVALLKQAELGYSFPRVHGADVPKVFELRAAGLGVLANIPGEAKAVACIEDTAVRIEDLDSYISEFEKMMESYGQRSVFYAHAGDGEIHLRPILNLKKQDDVDLFYEITKSTAQLVKKYNGSLSGEHGDGRVRAEFIPLMIGDENYELLKEIKSLWDPHNIFNPGKIVEASPMTSSLRYEPGQVIPEPDTIFRFDREGGIIRAAEKCNGSGDCRKINISGGTMCPSYKATRDEKDTTRARANALRRFLSHPADREKPFNSNEVKEVLDLCLSCKACATECPSNVDMTKLKAEFQYQYQKLNGSSRRSRLFANINNANRLASLTYPISKWTIESKWISGLIKRAYGIALERSLPSISRISLRQYFNRKYIPSGSSENGKVYLFCDEFTNYNDTEIGIKALHLLNRLGYEVLLADHPESGRAAFSKGFLEEAKKCAEENVKLFVDLVSREIPLIGIEPSAILGFRDEYPKIVDQKLEEKAVSLSQHVYTIEEFLKQEIEAGKITEADFNESRLHIAIHGHCHQKALSSVSYTAQILSIPKHFTTEIIPSGCCGMAGSFGYEEEHFELSMKIAEDVLFPAIRDKSKETLIVASGTSCRHQIKDGLERNSFHPVEILFDALRQD